MSLSIPKTVEVLGQEFAVRVLTREESLFRGAPESAVGATDLNKQVIMVRGPEDLSAHQALETLVHETLHGIFYLFGLRAHILDEDDEPLIKALAPALLHTLRSNPLLVEAIMSEIEGAAYGEALHVHAD